MAVELRTDLNVVHFVVTWGRVQDPVNPEPLEALVLGMSGRFVVDATSVHVCGTMQEAREAPYFYESLISFSAYLAERRSSEIPYETWRQATDARMRAGRDFYYLGDPARDYGRRRG